MSARVVTPTGRIGRIVQVVEGCALVRFHTGRAWFALVELTPAPERKSRGIGART